MVIPLQLKVFIGFASVFAVACGLIAVLFHERSKVREIEREADYTRSIYEASGDVHEKIGMLALSGEGVVFWSYDDYAAYHRLRLGVDSFLVSVKPLCRGRVTPMQIDTLRLLLEDKEKHLLSVMQAVRRKDVFDADATGRLSDMAKRTVRVRTVKKKKKGLAGLFGGKKTVQVVEKSIDLQRFGDDMAVRLKEHSKYLEACGDSVRRHNKELNAALNSLMVRMDRQVAASLAEKERRIRDVQAFSYKLSASIPILALVFLVVLFVVIRRDIRRERKTKERLSGVIRENNELLEMRKNIILTVSHDIRGPLGNIANCAELASATSAKRKRDGYLDDITHSCTHALRLANRLLDVYKTFEPNELLNETPFRLDAFLDGISNDFKRKANAKALMFEYEREGCGVTVKGDVDKLEQVMDNLLSNAVKFTNSGTVRFRAVYANGTLAVEISDTGMGMDEETLGRVFRPFERAAQDVNSEGFGLGLAITKGLMNALGGSLDVESELGKGSVFSLKLPLPETDEEVTAVEVPAATSAVLPKRVLVVDDDCILLKVIEDMLGRNGVECTACRNAREAMEVLGKNGYDLVLTDVQMPDTDGFGLLKLLRTADIGCSRTVPVAVMTARGDGDSGVYLQAGFCGCLHKPFSMRQFTAFLSSCVAHESHRPKFNFEGLLEHTGDRRHMMEVLLRQSEDDKADLEKALAVPDREALRAVTHRMLSAWGFLGADGLIENFRNVLVDTSVDDETVREETARIVYAAECLIEEAKALIKNEDLRINDAK